MQENKIHISLAKKRVVLIEINEAIERIKEHIGIHETKEPRAIYVTIALYKAIHALRSKEKLKPVPFKITAHDFCNGYCETTGKSCEFLNRYNIEYQYTDYKCPSCGKRVSDGTPNNCCHCGQALDWSKE